LLTQLGEQIGTEFVGREAYIEIFSGFKFEENPISAKRLWNEPTSREKLLSYLVNRLIDTGTLRGHIRTLECFSEFLTKDEIISLYKEIAARSQSNVSTRQWQNEFRKAFTRVLRTEEWPAIAWRQKHKKMENGIENGAIQSCNEN
jgi:hypothetical protein